MRITAAFIAISLAASGAAAADPKPVIRDNPNELRVTSIDPRCAPTRPYVADMNGVFRGQKVAPKKLNQLPPGTAYMAVKRHIGGCDAPLTMVDYRRAPKR